MKKTILVSLGLILIGLLLTFAPFEPTSFSLKVKMGFIGKICLIVGIISFWLFALLPYFTKKIMK